VFGDCRREAIEIASDLLRASGMLYENLLKYREAVAISSPGLPPRLRCGVDLIAIQYPHLAWPNLIGAFWIINHSPR
jgi:hypothetical protein